MPWNSKFMQYAAAYDTCVVVYILLRSFSYQWPAMCELWNYGYRAKCSKWLSEAAKWNNAIDYVDWVLSRPRRMELNRDIWACRRQRSGFRDRVSQTWTVPEKPGRLVSLVMRICDFALPLYGNKAFNPSVTTAVWLQCSDKKWWNQAEDRNR